MSDLAYISAKDLAARIRVGELTSRATLEFFLDRVAALDGPINSVVTIDAERAKAEVDEADRRQASGAELGPLHGVPMTIKDSFMTVEMGTTSGAPEFADYVPTEDAWPVAAYREAGAVTYGKTNLPIFAGDFQSYNVAGPSNRRSGRSPRRRDSDHG